MKLYLAGPMFTAAEEAHNLRLAAKLRDHGFAVFCPNESEPNSDKTRTDITPRLIYDVDIEAVESCNVLISGERGLRDQLGGRLHELSLSPRRSRALLV